MLLSPKQIVKSTRGEAEYSVVSLIAEGGQGEVYRVTSAAKTYALKWYLPTYPPQDPSLWRRLELNIDDGPPTSRFLWPFDLVGPDHRAPAGYVMPWTDYPNLVQFLGRRMEPDPSFRIIATAGLGFAEDFFRLHSRGRYYSDISANNVFFDPVTGDIRIGDTDNVAIKEERPPVITWSFVAPEIARGEAAPSRFTDLHSLAVLLFELLMIAHPLKGKREQTLAFDPNDPDGSHRLCGFEPVFIWDPNDESNRPVPQIHENAIIYWRIYLQLIRDLFTRAFTNGLKDPKARITEDEWRRAMTGLRDAIFGCSQGGCGAENFYDLDHMRTAGRPAACWHCGTELALPPRLRLDGSRIVMLVPDTVLFPHHITGDPFNFSVPLARVEANPLRLCNLSGHVWSIRGGDTAPIEIWSGEALPLDTPCQVSFGKSEGQIAVSPKPVSG